MENVIEKTAHVGRPKTGRSLARYWLKNTVIATIEEKARKAGFDRPADYLERKFAR